MKAIMVMFDSLNRKYLPPYSNSWVKAPNFERLAEHTVTFDNCYCGSMPCMPARRELHTGRYNFLHRGWGPLEPFDDSMPEILKEGGIHTHLVSDHSHYWEDGGATYHTRYSTWESVRGQEGDCWKGNLDEDIKPSTVLYDQNPLLRSFKMPMYHQDAVNRTYRKTVDAGCQTEVFDKGLEFIETNGNKDNWFLQIESFDPHEPFFTYEQYLSIYNMNENSGPDWPPYDQVHETMEMVEMMRKRYAAMISMCDENLGRVLDLMDRYDLWKDTMLIVNTDHGYLLGEHGWWAKNMMPCWDEIVHLPLFIWNPECGCKGVHRKQLVQTIDLAPTLLTWFGQSVTTDMQGKDLKGVIMNDEEVRKYALFGYFGNQMNVTDGKYVYMMNAVNSGEQLYEYTLMPCLINRRMGQELEYAVLSKPFSFSKRMPLLKIPSASYAYDITSKYGSMLYDLEADPEQKEPISDRKAESKMKYAIQLLMKVNDAPEELFTRFGFAKNK